MHTSGPVRNPSPPFRGERKGPTRHGSAQSAARGQAPAWEGEVGGGDRTKSSPHPGPLPQGAEREMRCHFLCRSRLPRNVHALALARGAAIPVVNIGATFGNLRSEVLGKELARLAYQKR